MGGYLGIHTAFCLTTGGVWELRQAHTALEPDTPICVRDGCLQPHVHLCESWPPCTGEHFLALCLPFPLVAAFQGGCA